MPDQAYLAGSAIEGKVVLDLIKSKAINGSLRITLSGHVKVEWGRTSDEHTIFDEMSVNLWGTGSETPAPGEHEFPYIFHLPEDLPSSYEDIYGHIRYILTAVLPTRKSEVIRQKIIKVHNKIYIDRPPELLNPLFSSKEKILCCLCCASAPIKLSVAIYKGGYVCGESVIIREYHRCRRITNVCAILFRKTTYHIRNSGESKFSCKRIVSASRFTDANSIDQPGSKAARLIIPEGIISITSDAINVSYFVVVKLLFEIPFIKTLQVMIPITIGNTQRSTSGGDIIETHPVATTTISSTPATTQPAIALSDPQPSTIPSAPHCANMPRSPQPPFAPSVPHCATMLRCPQSATVPSAPPYSWSNVLEDASERPLPAIVPSAPVYPVPITSLPAQPNTDIPDFPPPLYSEC